MNKKSGELEGLRGGGFSSLKNDGKKGVVFQPDLEECRGARRREGSHKHGTRGQRPSFLDRRQDRGRES